MSVQLPDNRSPSGHALEAFRTIAHGSGEGLTSGAMYSYSFEEIIQISWHNIDVTNDEQVSDSFQFHEKLIGHGNIPNLHFLSRHQYTHNQHGELTASISEAEEICRPD